MRLYRTALGPVVQSEGRHILIPAPRGDEARAVAQWDDLINAQNLVDTLRTAIKSGSEISAPTDVLSPVGTQEIWAAGVTYFRSRTARMEESKGAGGGNFYDRVYEADRPEIFFKATPTRVIAPGGTLRLRKDSRWIVPEPELTLVINRRAEIIGYTVGNDLSCRDIEGENPLYLPQAKTFDGCAAVGPAILVSAEPLPTTTEIRLSIKRNGSEVSRGSTTLADLKRTPKSLVDWLFRELSFTSGCFLMTGTGVVPDDGFTLQPNDEVNITIEPIGTLTNRVE